MRILKDGLYQEIKCIHRGEDGELCTYPEMAYFHTKENECYDHDFEPETVSVSP